MALNAASNTCTTCSKAKSNKPSEEYYTRGMQYQPQMTKLAQNKAKTCENSG